METSELRLVTDADPERPQDRSVPAALLLGALALGAFGLSTWLGADEARRKVEVAELAEAAVQMALERGSEDPQVRETLIDLRRTLGWRPLESRTRVVYASLVLALSARAEDAQLAGFQAARAAELSPVTVSVVHAAVLVLSHTGELDHALALVRGMFGYDARRAARLLAQVDSLVLVASVDGAVPETAEAWMAWSRQLANDLRAKEAEAWLERTFDRWPDHLPARTRLAAGAFRRRDWTALAKLVPPDGTFPTEPAAAPLLIWRARLRARAKDEAGALEDIRAALDLTQSRTIRTLAGDVYEALGRIARARNEWNRALHGARAGQASARRGLLVRLARLEDVHGEPAAALRLWETLLELDPEHAEARRRVDDLAGFRR